MRYLWVDAGNGPNYDKARANGITGFYFDLFDPLVTKTFLKAVESRGYKVGVYLAWNWPQFEGKTGVEIADIVSSQVKKIAGTALTNQFPKVQFDIEAHDPDLILAVLRRWRELLPNHDTSWTLESFQGGWMTPEFVKGVLDCRVRVVPQFYLGAMQPVAQDMALRDLTSRGFPEEIISGFYDAKEVGSLYRWNGFAFTQGRLP